MRATREREFEGFVRARSGQLLGTAMLLARDPDLAEDLVQTALVRVYQAWGRANRGGEPGAYAHRVLVNCFIDHRRRSWVRRERSVERLPEIVAVEQTATDPMLLAALRTLPDRMRAAVVLRHVEDRSVEEVADLLGCSVGTVKSQTSRGLEKLRAALPGHPSHPRYPEYQGEVR